MSEHNAPREKLKRLIGAQVHAIELGYDVKISLNGGKDRAGKYAEVRINVPFQFNGHGKDSTMIDPDRLDTVVPLLELVHSKIAAISYDDDLMLSISLDGGYSLKVPLIPKYEAWTISAEGLGDYIGVEA